MAIPNIVNVNLINGKTSTLQLTTSLGTICENSVGSNSVYKINSLIISNKDGINYSDVSIVLNRDSIDYYIAKNITVPAGTSLLVVTKDMGIYLEEGDKLKGLASSNDDLDSVCSYEYIVS